MKNKRLLRGILIPLIVILFLVIINIPILPKKLVLSDINNKILYLFPKNTKTFTYSFTHSVNKGNIREIYEVNYELAEISLIKSYFESFGAGMIDTQSNLAQFNMSENNICVDFHTKPQKEYIFASAGIAGQTIKVGSISIDIFKLNPYKSVKISVIKPTILQRIWRYIIV